MVVRSRRLITTLTALALVASLGGYARPPVASAADSPFTDIAGTTFEADIEWLWAEGITVGCSPKQWHGRCGDLCSGAGQRGGPARGAADAAV